MILELLPATYNIQDSDKLGGLFCSNPTLTAQALIDDTDQPLYTVSDDLHENSRTYVKQTGVDEFGHRVPDNKSLGLRKRFDHLVLANGQLPLCSPFLEIGLW